MLILTANLQDQLGDLGVDAYPYEGCGLLLGRVENGANVVAELYPVPNHWQVEEEKRVRFLITPESMLGAELAAAEQDLDIVGVFHSHPDHPPVASPRDLAWAAWPGYSYLITEVRDQRPGPSRSWQLLGDRSGFVEEDIKIEYRDRVQR